jgi:hypothetical protein
MNSTSIAREAFIVETLGEVATLLDRVEAVAPALDASPLALIDAGTEPAGRVTAFESRMAGITENAKVQAVKRIARRTDEIARGSTETQTRAMADAARICSGPRSVRPCSRSRCRCSTWRSWPIGALAPGNTG